VYGQNIEKPRGASLFYIGYIIWNTLFGISYIFLDCTTAAPNILNPIASCRNYALISMIFGVPSIAF